jgi:hypothetical protein
MDFNGPARPLSTNDISLIAGYLGCHIAAVHAVLAVEAAGKGFDAKGRPKMLFEPHVFWRELGQGAKRTAAAKAGLAYAKWKPGAYPSDSYPRLAKAMAIDERAALRSASWGLGQVMGFNHSAAGFPSVQEMVRAMTISEGAQIYAMARFIVTNSLHRALKARDWEAFAKGYNGSGYRENGYHTKLKAAYDKRPASEKVTPPPTTAAELEMLAGVLVKRPVEPTPSPLPVQPVVIPAPFDPPPEPRTAPVDTPEPETAGPGESGSGGLWGWLAGIAVALGATGAMVWWWNPLGWW